uniref:NADH-ubiquinone oxidoreductase chain 4 n=1 Tax=Ledropsis sp. TaxID=3133679 RepID=A0AAU6PC42_9HEMI
MMKMIMFMMILPILNKKLIMFSLTILTLKVLTMNTNKFMSMISISLSMDNWAQILILLTIIITSMMTMTMKNQKILISINIFMLIILTMMFMSLKMMWFYMMFELSLVPMTIMIMGWGYQPERMMAGLYLLFYTMTASLPLIISIIFMYKQMNNDLFSMKFSQKPSSILNMSTMMAFLVKLPMFMLHFWLPKAHVQAPIFGSMILAGILLKIGGFGIIRFSSTMENSFMLMSTLWYSISIVGATSISLICMIQGDIKSMIAYSSISHMSMCLMSLLSMNKTGMLGGMTMMIGHGLCSSGMFFLSNMNYERTMSRSMYINKGMMNFMPTNTMMWFIMSCLNMGCPPSINFISEISIMMTMLKYWEKSYMFILFTSLIVSYYSFYMFSYTNHGQFSSNFSFSSTNIKEFNILIYHIYPMITMSFITEVF